MGFLLVWFVMVICLVIGVVYDVVLGLYSGKGSGEFGFVCGLFEVFFVGDVMFVDVLYCNYFFIVV